MQSNTVQQALRTAMQLHQAERLAEAESLYRQVLAAEPDNAKALHLLGLVAERLGRREEALGLLERAVAANPRSAESRYELGRVLSLLGKPNEALEAYRRAIELSPGLAEAHTNMGVLLHQLGLVNEALAAHQRAVRLKPALAEAHYNLGVAANDLARLAEAVAAFGAALAIKPDYAEALNNLGIALRSQGKLTEAGAAFEGAIKTKPDHVEAHANLGSLLTDEGKLDEAEVMCARAIQFKADCAGAHYNLANVLKEQGRLDEALKSYRTAIDLQPGSPAMHSSLLLALSHHPESSRSTLREEHRQWARRHAEPPGGPVKTFGNDRTADRRLRIGYISADFRQHACAHFLWPLLRSHDHERFEITCYAQLLNPDSVTDRFRKTADRWRPVAGLSDRQLADLIRADGIDILVDAMGHTASNRLPAIARKPAPIVASWMGYIGPTSLSAINYRITDTHVHPREFEEAGVGETPIIMPDSLWCYDPMADGPEVNSLPALGAGHVTFGCLNSFGKVNEGVLKTWARILSAVEDSRLLVLSPEGSARRRLAESMQGMGITAERVEFVAKRPRADYLGFYHRVDISLDPFPYNGHTTSLDSWWMGVPVVSLAGETAVGRMGVSHACSLGMSRLVGWSVDEYVKIAAELARDVPSLAEMRRTLRPRIEASPLMDAPRFARNMEGAYRRMWEDAPRGSTGSPGPSVAAR